MSLIDGIGDEVTQFLLAVFLVLIVAVAWWSTNTIRDPYSVRSVYLLDYRVRMLRDYQRTYQSNRATSLQYNRQNHRHTQVRVGNNNTSTTADSVQLEDPIDSNIPTAGPVPIAGATDESAVAAAARVVGTGEISAVETETDLAESQAEQERATIIRVMDADESEVRRRRIAFFAGRRVEDPSNQTLATAPVQSEPFARNTVSVEGAQDAVDNSEEDEQDDVTSMPEPNMYEGDYDRELDPSIMEHNYAEMPLIDNRIITVKLKYTNDDLKVVTGKLQERLGDFKLRHFADEYSTDRSVRLIFNGKILSDDDRTLSSCGIFHNCVVHCLVVQGRTDARPRSTASEESAGDPRNTPFAEAARHAQFVRVQQQNAADRNGQERQQREWNLGTLFSRCTNLILVCAWYLRYSVPHMWTMTATLCLIALTGFSLIAHVGIFMPSGQTEQNENIRATQMDRDLNR